MAEDGRVVTTTAKDFVDSPTDDECPVDESEPMMSSIPRLLQGANGTKKIASRITGGDNRRSRAVSSHAWTAPQAYPPAPSSKPPTLPLSQGRSNPPSLLPPSSRSAGYPQQSRIPPPSVIVRTSSSPAGHHLSSRLQRPSSSPAHRPDPQKRVPNNHLVSTSDPSLLQQSKLRLPSEHRPTAGNDTHSIPRPLWQNIVATRIAQFGGSTEKLDQPLNSPKRVKEHSFPLPQAQSKLSPPPSKLHVQIQSTAQQPKPQQQEQLPNTKQQQEQHVQHKQQQQEHRQQQIQLKQHQQSRPPQKQDQQLLEQLGLWEQRKQHEQQKQHQVQKQQQLPKQDNAPPSASNVRVHTSPDKAQDNTKQRPQQSRLKQPAQRHEVQRHQSQTPPPPDIVDHHSHQQHHHAENVSSTSEVMEGHEKAPSNALPTAVVPPHKQPTPPPFSSPSHTSPSHPSSHSGYKHSAYTSVPLSHAPTTMSHGPIPAAAMVQPPYPVAYTIPPSEQWGHHSQQQKVKGYPKITVRSSGVPVYHHSQPQHNKSTTSPPPSHLPYPPQPASTKIGVSSGVIAHSAATNGDVMLLHKLLSSRDVDPMCRDENDSTLLHKAAAYGQLSVIQLLLKELPSSMLQHVDNFFLTPAMLAIQGGHLECLKWLIEEGGVSLTVVGAGGETLLHHAAFHGQAQCLEYLLHRVASTNEHVAYVDESGVTPAHFAAQRGHLDCLRLLINEGYDVSVADREHQTPVDWADAMGQHSCMNYLLMVELCYKLSRNVLLLTHQVEILQQQNEQLSSELDWRGQEHHTAIVRLQHQHQEKLNMMHDKYAGLTVSLLKGQEEEKATADSPTPSEGKESGSKKKIKNIPKPLQIQHITINHDPNMATTPNEVLMREMSTVEERLHANREMRKNREVSAMRSLSPLRKMRTSTNNMQYRQDKHSKGGGGGGGAKRELRPPSRTVKFAPTTTVTEYHNTDNHNPSQAHSNSPLAQTHSKPLAH